jgi:hypothetical protein
MYGITNIKYETIEERQLKGENGAMGKGEILKPKIVKLLTSIS